MAGLLRSIRARPRGFLCGCPDAVGARDPAPCKPHVEKPEWRTYANSSTLRGQRRCLCTPRMGQAVPWNPSPKASRPAHPACTLYASLLADEKRERNCVALEAVSSRPEIQCRGKARRLLFRPGFRGRASGFHGAEPTGLPPHSTHWCRHGLAEPEPPIKGLAPRFAGLWVVRASSPAPRTNGA